MTYSELQDQLDSLDEQRKVEMEYKKRLQTIESAANFQYMGIMTFAIALQRPVPCMIYVA